MLEIFNKNLLRLIPKELHSSEDFYLIRFSIITAIIGILLDVLVIIPSTYLLEHKGDPQAFAFPIVLSLSLYAAYRTKKPQLVMLALLTLPPLRLIFEHLQNPVLTAFLIVWYPVLTAVNVFNFGVKRGGSISVLFTFALLAENYWLLGSKPLPYYGHTFILPLAAVITTIGIVGFFNSCAPDSAAVDVTTIENTTQQGASSWAAFLQRLGRRGLETLCTGHTTHAHTHTHTHTHRDYLQPAFNNRNDHH